MMLVKVSGWCRIVVLDGSGNLNTNAQINYNYLPYWDVSQNELDFNAPLAGSAPLKHYKILFTK